MTYPLISVSVDPTSVRDDAKLGNALKTLAGNDPKLSFHRDAVIGQTIIYGESEEQLDAHLGVLRRDYDVVANVGSWQVAYLETIVRKTETCYTYKGRTGEQGRYARLSVAFEPVDRHTGVIFDGSAVTGTMPPEYYPHHRGGHPQPGPNRRSCRLSNSRFQVRAYELRMRRKQRHTGS